MIDKDGTVLRNLEDQVQYLTDLNEWASLGFTIAGKMVSTDTLPTADTTPNGTTYVVGVKAPYHFWTAVNGGWVDLGEFPRPGPPGSVGPKGDSIVGPRGPEGKPSNIPGPAGKNGGGLGVDNITSINLATGTQTVTYDSTNGATVTAQGKIVAAGQDYNITADDKIPLVEGENVTIATENNKLKINAKQAVKSVNGKVGHVELTIPTKTSDLVNDAEFITPSYHDNTKQNTLISGDNIKTINNESILGPGNITISGGGGGGTDTGFDNVRKIDYVDHGMAYNPNTGEYLVSSGISQVYLKGSNTPINIETVQSFGIMPGNNVTFTEEQIGDEWKLKINATGGGSSTDGFSNLKGLTLTPTTYQGSESPSGKFAFTGSGTYTLKDNSSGGIQELSFQLPVVPGDGIIFDKDTGNSCVIKAADYKPAITLETYTASQNTNHYGRIYYTFDVGNSTVATDIANGKYNVTIYDQTSGGGYYYCPLQGENMTFLGEEVPNDNNSGKPSSIVGWSFKAKESETVVGFWRDSFSLSGGGGGGGSSSLYQHTITMQGSQYKYKITVVNSYQGSITSSSIWKEIYGTNRFTATAIVTDSMDKTVSISSVYVYILPTNGLQILFFPSNQSSQNSESIGSSSTWEDNIISL